jgi:glycosyltransferase involved in cell wall biosynthesis
LAALVSILIPAFNAQKWIRESIQSALLQTWQNKEIIVVDDGSRDDTLRIARSFESKILKVLSQDNTGACGARNRALSSAQGDYIQWLDADDLLTPGKISSQLEQTHGDLTSLTLLTSPFGTFYYRHRKATFTPTSLWQDLSPVDWIINKFTEHAWMNPVTWLVSRKLTEMAGPWDERLSTSGDDDGEVLL